MTNSSNVSTYREAKLFRDNLSQVVRIPVEFALSGDRVLIHREGSKLIIEPILRATSLTELLAKWRQEPVLTPEDQLPMTEDMPVNPEDIF